MASNNIYKKTIRILYWNTRSFLQRLQEIQRNLNNFDLIICTESWLTEKDHPHFPGFVVYRADRLHSRGGGIIMIIRKNLAFTEINNIISPDPSVEICGLHFNNVLPALNVYACYRSPGLNLNQNQWNNIINNIHSNNSIFVGDFNAHNIAWNCRYTDSNGDKLENSLYNRDLFLHNHDSNTYTNIHKNYSTNIDLVISTIDISNIINATVCDETWSSDHHPIFIDVNLEKVRYEKKTFKLNSLKTDWSNFCNQLEIRYTRFLSLEYDSYLPSEKYDCFVKTITEAVTFSSPKRSNKNFITKKNNPVPWWDEDCNRVKRLRSASFKKWQFTKKLEDLINYKKQCCIAKKTFISKKRALGNLLKALTFVQIRNSYGINVKYSRTAGHRPSPLVLQKICRSTTNTTMRCLNSAHHGFKRIPIFFQTVNKINSLMIILIFQNS